MSSVVVDLVSAIKFGLNNGLMVSVCVGFDGGEGIVHILDLEALENVKNAVSRMEVIVNYSCALAGLLEENLFYDDIYTYIDQIPLIHDTVD